MRRTSLLVGVVVFALCLSIPAASAPSSTLRAVIDMEVVLDCPLTPPSPGDLLHVDDPTACWTGPVTGDINGTIAFWGTDATFVVGDTDYFMEVFTFEPDSGGYLYGVHQGVFKLKTPYLFSSKGWVTAASPEWAHLIGATYTEKGQTSDINDWPITAFGTKMTLTRATA